MNALETLTAEEAKKETTELDGEKQFRRLKADFVEDDDHNKAWRSDVPNKFKFIKGGKHQWDKDALEKYDATDRAAVTFNRVHPIVDAVNGVEINTRTQALFYPRDPQNEDEAEANEIISAGVDWMGDQCRAPRQQSQAFRNAFICGLGVTEAIVDFKERPKGKYIERRCNPAEFRWDCDAREPNLTDAERFHRVRKVKLRRAAQMFPTVPIDALNADYAAPDLVEGKNSDERRHKDSEGVKIEDPNSLIHLVHSQWYEDEPYHLIEASIPQIGGLGDMEAQAFQQLQALLNGETEFSEEEFKRYSAMLDSFGIPFQSVKLTKRCVKQAFLGHDRVLSGILDAPCKTNFNWNFITYDIDDDGIPYGAVSLMEDPQRFANKWLSQTLHILNSTAKGGIIAEEDAFEDLEEAEETYARADAITFVRPGTIAKGKIMAKPGGGLSAPYLQLTEFAISAIRDAVGVSLELLGMRETAQAGVLEHQRKQAGLTILAPLFDAHKEFKERNAIVRLFFLQTVFADGRLIRVTGEDGSKKALRLAQDKVVGEFDCEVDEAPTSPNQKEQDWMIIREILALFKDMLDPAEILEFLRYSPLPVRLVNILAKKLEQPPSAEEVEAQQIMKAAQVAEVEGKQAKATRDNAAAMRDRMGMLLDIVDKAMQAREQQLQQAAAVAASQAPQSMSPEELLQRLAGMVQEPIGMRQTGLEQPPQPPALNTFMRSPAAVDAEIIEETGGLNGTGQ